MLIKYNMFYCAELPFCLLITCELLPCGSPADEYFISVNFFSARLKKNIKKFIIHVTSSIIAESHVNSEYLLNLYYSFICFYNLRS